MDGSYGAIFRRSVYLHVLNRPDFDKFHACTVPYAVWVQSTFKFGNKTYLKLVQQEIELKVY